MTSLKDHITKDKNIQFGKPVFSGTRVPVQSLFWHLEKGYTIDEFLADFPSVSKKQAEAVIDWTANQFEFSSHLINENFNR